MRCAKLITIALTTAVLSTSVTAFAVSVTDGNVKDLPQSVQTAEVTHNPTIERHFTLLVNGKIMESQNTKVYAHENGTVMIPLRAVAENLGYHVVWNSEKNIVELNKENNFSMVKIGEDYYSFGKMAPVNLGTASECNKDVTYVPLSFISDVLRLNVKTDDTGAVSITSDKASQEKESEFSNIGKISKINKTDKSTSILIDGNSIGKGYNGPIVLYVSNETKIVDPITNITVPLQDLKEGDLVRGYYGPVLTASLPPIGNAVKIEVLKGICVRRGLITQINKEEKSILVGDTFYGIKLNIPKDAKIIKIDGTELKLDDLQLGMEIDAYHDLATTLSLPAISTAKKIVVNP